MVASTHTLGSNPVGNFGAALTRKARPGYADDTRAVTQVQSGLEPERASDEHAALGLRSIRTYHRPCELVEHALFVVTLAAIGYLYFGVCLAELI